MIRLAHTVLKKASRTIPVITLITLMAGHGAAQDTTGTATQETAVTTSTASAADQPTSPETSETTHAVILLGDKAGFNPDSPRRAPYPELLTATETRLGGNVADYTSVGLTLASTLDMIQSAPEVQADIVLLFGGLADEAAEIKEDQVRENVVLIATELRQRNPEMQIFLIPSATYLGTLFSAHLRLAAIDADISFIPLGTEVGGHPFDDAFDEIALELESTSSEADEQTAPSPELESEPVLEADSEATADSGSFVSTSPAPPGYLEQRANLQRELGRIAGDTSDSSIMPLQVDQLSTQALTQPPAQTSSETTGTVIPPGGQITKRGAEAQENINMRPLPALKAFEPQVPVPRNRIDIKEPALSR